MVFPFWSISIKTETDKEGANKEASTIEIAIHR